MASNAVDYSNTTLAAQSFVMRRFQCRLLALLLYIGVSTILVEPSSAWSAVPRRIRLNSKGQPRLCSVVGLTLNVMTRSILCLPTSCNDFSIDVAATSNRQILRGNIQKISINVRQSRSPFLQVDRFQLDGSNLTLGWTPLVLASLPFVIKIFKPPIFKLLALFWFWKIIRAKRLDTSEGTATAANGMKSPSSTTTTLGLSDRLKKALGGSPCQLDYMLLLTNDDMRNSSLLRYLTNTVLQSLMENSVLKTAAVAGDTARILQDASIDADTGQLILKESNFRLTRLLSATSFELENSPQFTSDGHFLLPSKAVIRDEASQGSSQSTLYFTLRTRIQGNDIWLQGKEGKQHALEFASPEIFFDVQNTSLPRVVLAFLQALWVPVGSGVAFPLGRRHRIQLVRITDGRFQMNGRLFLFGSRQGSGGLINRFGDIFGGNQRLLP